MNAGIIHAEKHTYLKTDWRVLRYLDLTVRNRCSETINFKFDIPEKKQFPKELPMQYCQEELYKHILVAEYRNNMQGKVYIYGGNGHLNGFISFDNSHTFRTTGYIELFEEGREQSFPWHEVIVNGEKGMESNLVMGKYTVNIRQGGYDENHKWIVITTGQTNHTKLTTQRKPAKHNEKCVTQPSKVKKIARNMKN